jgi:hypothetical protein
MVKRAPRRVRRFVRHRMNQWWLEGRLGIAILGHRPYVGAHWDEVGRLQFDFMVEHGLQPTNVLLDIGCGSLRGGVHFIGYLDRGNYLGIEKERALIRLALAKELPRDVRKQKRPEFVISSVFEFDRFSKQPDFSLAQSLFTHLTPTDIELALGNLRAIVSSDHQLYATFSSGDSERNPLQSASHKNFFYSPDELIAMGAHTGWSADYIGDWGHPRNQKMMRFTPAAT